jgi:hypothetical protein
MTKVTIKKIYRSDKDKSGKPFLTKDGRPYTRLAVWTQEHGEQALSGFGNARNAMWREGDQVELDTERVMKDGKEYLNFKEPNPIKTLEARLEKVEAWIKAEIAKKPKEPTIKYPKEVEAEEDILNNLQF